MLSYVITIAVVWCLFHLNGRISKIEKLIQGKSVLPQNLPQQQTSSTVSVGVSSQMSEQGAVISSAVNTQGVSVSTQASPTVVPSAISAEEASGRFLGKIGIGAVLLGVAFFLKYAFDNNWIGPSGRVMIGILFGVAFLVLGQYLRKKYLQYSDILMGGGIAILYLSIYSAQAFYGLISSATSGVLMFCVTVLAFAISIVNATPALALIGVIGGFATPALSGARENNMLTLFTYLTVLNLGVLGVSFFKKWPKLIVAGFIGTGLNFIAWFSGFYSEVALAPTLFFLFVSFIIFLAASVARAITAGTKAGTVDYILLGADAFCFASMAYFLLERNYYDFVSFGAVFIAIIYMMVAYVVNKYNSQDIALNIFLPGLAVTFLSIAVPLQFSGPWIAVAWLVESVALYFIASMISNRGFQVMGLIVYCLGLFDSLVWYMESFDGSYRTFVPIFNGGFAILSLAVVVAYVVAYMYMRYGSITEVIRTRGITAFVVIANIVTIFAFTAQISQYYSAERAQISYEYQSRVSDQKKYSSDYDYSRAQTLESDKYYDSIRSIKNKSNITVSIFWALYAALLTAIGFARRYAGPRRLGLVLFVITGLKVLTDVWSLGQLYRIISFIAFGIIALVASFAYAKYKDRLKAVIMLALLLTSGLTFSVASATTNLEAWKYMRMLSVPAVSDFAKVELPSGLSKMSRDFHDVRIINQSGDETPYLITRNLSIKGGVVNSRILNKSITNGTTQFIVDNGENGQITTRVDILTNTNNFKRQVSIYSSPTLIPINSSAWALVTDKGYIFKFTDSVTQFSSGKKDVEFSANTARYFKVVIGEGPEGAVDISGATLYGDTSVTAPIYNKQLAVVVYNNPARSTTEVTFDLGSSGYLTHAVELNSTDTNYSRKVVVEVSNDATSWTYVTDGYISSISTPRFSGVSNRIEYREQDSRYIRVSIVNNDNRPISIGGKGMVEGPIVSSIFETRAGETYTLYYGNPTADKPVYDITRIASYIEENGIPSASVGVESINPSYIEPKGQVVPFTERYSWLLNGVLVLVVVVLGIAIGLYLRKYKRDNSSSGMGGGFGSQG